MAGIKPKGKVKIEWSPEFAYAIGLLVTDGCLYNDQLHINLTSKDIEMLENFKNCLQINNIIGRKSSGSSRTIYYQVQFGDVLFYKFLLSIGLMSAKSKIIGEIKVPSEYFFDYLRGCFDGDGCFYSYWDPRWRSSFMFYVEFISASRIHIDWLRLQIESRLNIRGHITSRKKGNQCYQLKYGKKEGLELIQKMYYNPSVVCLSRKRSKIEKALKQVGTTVDAQVSKLVDELP